MYISFSRRGCWRGEDSVFGAWRGRLDVLGALAFGARRDFLGAGLRRAFCFFLTADPPGNGGPADYTPPHHNMRQIQFKTMSTKTNARRTAKKRR
jgi:hypothetical protein